MTTAIIYTRFSPRPNARECDSCEKQEERCRAYCEQERYEVVKVCSDPDTSGGILDRPGLLVAIEVMRGDLKIIGTFRGTELLAASYLDPPAILVVDAVDRLARDMLVGLTIRHEVEKAGGRIEYANGTPADESPEGRLFSNILAAFAAYERDRVRYATSRGMKRRQENGEWFGKPPVGWMRDPECSTQLIKCPEEQSALDYASLLRARRVSWWRIAEKVNRDCKPFRGGPWKSDTIRKALAKEES